MMCAGIGIGQAENIALTVPCMHDGRFATLEEVIKHYDSGVKRTPTLDPNLGKHPVAGPGFSASGKKAFAAFPRTLTDDSFTAPLSPIPFDSP